MTNHLKSDIWTQVENERIIAVVVVDNPSQAVSTVSALQDGGVNTIELTLRTPSAMKAITHVRKMSPDIILGVGTVLTSQQLQQCHDAGADFAVAPGLNQNVICKAFDVDLPFAPGIMTPSDIEIAVELGCRHLKFFPAEPSGGLNYLNSVAAPYQHLELRYIPLGGINEGNCRLYLQSRLISAIGGSWIAPISLIRENAWNQIKERASKIRHIIDSVEGFKVCQ